MKNITIEIKYYQGVRLAALEHLGDPNNLPQTIEKLITWAKRHSLGRPGQNEVYTLAYDCPCALAPENFRLDVCRRIPSGLILDDKVIEKQLPSGRAAVARHIGPYHKIDETLSSIYRDWLDNSNETLMDYPCIYSYQNFAGDVPESALQTDVILFLKNK